MLLTLGLGQEKLENMLTELRDLQLELKQQRMLKDTDTRVSWWLDGLVSVGREYFWTEERQWDI